jgi:hypothetical protein
MERTWAVMSMGDRKAAMIRCNGVGLVDAKAKFRKA